MKGKSAILSLLLLLPVPLNGDWFDKLAAALDAYDQLTTTVHSNSSLLAASAAEYGLPQHWQAYWLDEPVFGTRIFLAETGQANAPVLFMVHGLGQIGMRDWLPIVPQLSQHYRVVLIDLPGFANSPPPNDKLSPTRYADLLHFVKPFFSSEPVVVVGHSMGAAVTLRYAHRYPGDVSQIALLDAAGILQKTAFIKHSVTDRMPIDQQDVSGALLGYVIGLQDYGNAVIEDIMNLPDPLVFLAKSDFAWGAALGRYPNINAALGLISEDFSSAIYEQQKPVSILWGGQDAVAPIRTAYVLQGNLSHARLDVIADAGHVPMASHANEVSSWLLQSIETPPDPEPVKIAEMNQGQSNYQCKKEFGGVVSGTFARMNVEECVGLVFDQVTAYEIIIRQSDVELINTKILRPSVSMEISDSSVMMTAGRVHGQIVLNDSRLDLAGVELNQDQPFEILGESRLVMSVSRAGKNRYLNADRVLLNTQF